MYKSVIFDFDGTICDTGEGVKKAQNMHSTRLIFQATIGKRLTVLSALRFL